MIDSILRAILIEMAQTILRDLDRERAALLASLPPLLRDDTAREIAWAQKRQRDAAGQRPDA